MNIQGNTLAATAAALALSPAAFAHGEKHGATLYHYFSSPDHVIGFGLLGIGVLVLGVRLLRRPAPVARTRRPPC